MFHDMRFGKGDDSAWLETHDIDMHVMAHVHGIDQAGGEPAAAGVFHGRRRQCLGVEGEAFRDGNSLHRLIGLADPMANRGDTARIADSVALAGCDPDESPWTKAFRAMR